MKKNIILKIILIALVLLMAIGSNTVFAKDNIPNPNQSEYEGDGRNPCKCEDCAKDDCDCVNCEGDTCECTGCKGKACACENCNSEECECTGCEGEDCECENCPGNFTAIAAAKGLPNLDDTGYKPTVSLSTGGSAFNIITQILSVLTVVGIIAVVIAIALIGFNTILGSASEKADYQQKLVGVVIAGIFMIAGSTIAKFIISIAENI